LRWSQQLLGPALQKPGHNSSDVGTSSTKLLFMSGMLEMLKVQLTTITKQR